MPPLLSRVDNFDIIDPLFQDAKFETQIYSWTPIVTHHHWVLNETPLIYVFNCDLHGVAIEFVDIYIQDNVLKVAGNLKIQKIIISNY